MVIPIWFLDNDLCNETNINFMHDSKITSTQNSYFVFTSINVKPKIFRFKFNEIVTIGMDFGYEVLTGCVARGCELAHSGFAPFESNDWPNFTLA